MAPQPCTDGQPATLRAFEDLTGATVTVTGGAGLIGSRIVHQLRDLGARPLTVCNLDAYDPRIYRLFGVREHDADVIVGDIRDPEVVRAAVHRSDYVVHAGALADVAACTRDPHRAIAVNIVGTQNVLDAVAATGRVRRLVFVSSASVYGNGHHERSPHEAAVAQALECVYGRNVPHFREAEALTPLSTYATTKAWGEWQTAVILGAVGTSYTTVRYFSVYGEPQVVKPGSHSWAVAWFAAHAQLGLPLHLHGGGQQMRDFVHVEDIAEGTVRALVAPGAHQATVNLGSGTPTSIRQIADLVRSHYPDTEVLETPAPPAIRWAAVPTPGTCSGSSAGSPPSRSRRVWPGTSHGCVVRRGHCPRGCGRRPRRRVEGPAHCLRGNWQRVRLPAFGGVRRVG